MVSLSLYKMIINQKIDGIYEVNKRIYIQNLFKNTVKTILLSLLTVFVKSAKLISERYNQIFWMEDKWNFLQGATPYKKDVPFLYKIDKLA